MFTVTGRLKSLTTAAPLAGSVIVSASKPLRDTVAHTLIVGNGTVPIDESGAFIIELASIERLATFAGRVPADVAYRLTVATPAARFTTSPFSPRASGDLVDFVDLVADADIANITDLVIEAA